jgi:AcrR family transcriptional regulator
MAATPRRSARKPLTPGRIVEAALAEAASAGDFTMRGLGARLGVDPMAVYRHFADKNALLDAMVDAALGDFTPPGPELDDPIEALRRMAHDFRAALLRHPGVSERVTMNRPALGPHTLALAEATLARLFALGLDTPEATSAFETLVQFITGFVKSEESILAQGPGAEAEWLREMQTGYQALPPGQFPHVTRMGEQIPHQSLDVQFGYAIDLLLEALAARAGR